MLGNFIASLLNSWHNRTLSNSRKGKFFSIFFEQRINNRNEDMESAIKVAAEETKINLRQAFELFDEVAHRRWHGLRTVREGEARAFLKMNAKTLAEITENILNKETKLTA